MTNFFYVHPDTDPKVTQALEDAYTRNIRIRIHYGFTKLEPDSKPTAKIGEVWLEEYDVMGTVGRSTGTDKVPLLIANVNSTGGGPIMTHRILRIQETKTGRDLYKHPEYQEPQFHLRDSKIKPYQIEAIHEQRDEVSARFKTPKAAKKWVEFMQGKRFSK